MKEQLYKVCEEVLGNEEESKKFLSYETLDELYEYFLSKIPDLTKDEFDEFVCGALESYTKNQSEMKSVGEGDLDSVSGGAMGWRQKLTAAALALVSFIPAAGASAYQNDNMASGSYGGVTKQVNDESKISAAFKKTKAFFKAHPKLVAGIGVGAVLLGGTAIVLGVRSRNNAKTEDNKPAVGGVKKKVKEEVKKESKDDKSQEEKSDGSVETLVQPGAGTLPAPPVPPAPPAPGAPPPPPPPPLPQGAPNKGGNAMNAVLAQIREGGARLNRTETKDRSAPDVQKKGGSPAAGSGQDAHGVPVNQADLLKQAVAGGGQGMLRKGGRIEDKNKGKIIDGMNGDERSHLANLFFQNADFIAKIDMKDEKSFKDTRDSAVNKLTDNIKGIKEADKSDGQKFLAQFMEIIKDLRESTKDNFNANNFKLRLKVKFGADAKK